MPSIAPTSVISRPLLHQERMVMRDLAAPTAKCAAREMMAATRIAGTPAIKKNGTTGMNAPTAVETAPDVADTPGSSAGLVSHMSARERFDQLLLFSAMWPTRRSRRRLPAGAPRTWKVSESSRRASASLYSTARATATCLVDLAFALRREMAMPEPMESAEAIISARPAISTKVGIAERRTGDA